MKEPRFLVENIQVEQPTIWQSERLQIYKQFRLIERRKKDGIQEHQRGVTKVEDGYVYFETFVNLTSISDEGDYWYIGYRPIGRDSGRCGFGYFRLYKNGIPEYGAIAVEDLRNKVNIQTGEAK